jgi:hypothetical protein
MEEAENAGTISRRERRGAEILMGKQFVAKLSALCGLCVKSSLRSPLPPRAFVLTVAAVLLSVAVWAQAPETPEVTFTGVSANVAEPGQSVRIRIFQWSDDRARRPLIAAMDPLPPPAPARGDAAAGGGRAAAGRAGGRGARGRGAPAAAPLTPAQALAGAIRRAPSIGYIWTQDVTGYSIKFAHRAPLPDGGERIVLAVDRRLGTHTAAWQPATTAPATEYPFTVLEIRLGPNGVGEARTSLTTNVVVDRQGDTLALEDYAAAPVILREVRKAS